MGEIKLGSEFEAIIQKKLQSGHYQNAAGVISAGLSLLDALGSGVDDTPEDLAKAINDAFEDGTDDIPSEAVDEYFKNLYLRDIKAGK
jgi:Arc/MetJ-type ribon-helix-helix transcriptional regulator